MEINNTLSSNISCWIDPPARAWNSNGSVITDLMNGLVACKTVNSILASAPSEVGGEITISVTTDEIEDLRLHRLQLKAFADGIHYEVAESIDIPFCLLLNPVLRAAYDLNPSDFVVRKGLFGIMKGDTLGELVSGTSTDITFKTAYEKQIKELDEDVISKSLKVVIEDSKFWQKEFEKASEIRIIAQEFIHTYGDKWSIMNKDKRKKALNQYCQDIGSVMDEKKWYELFRGEKVGVEVSWTSEVDPSSTAYGFIYSGATDGHVYINDKFGNNEDAQFDMYKILNTITHETRHQFQNFAINYPDRYDATTDIQLDWGGAQGSDYWIKPIEIDARAYAGMIIE